MFRLASMALLLLCASTATAQIPEMQAGDDGRTEQSVAMTPYRETVEPNTTNIRQRRPWDRQPREFAVPRRDIRPRDVRPNRGYNERWEYEAYRNPWMPRPRNRFNRYRRPIMCTGPYLAWVGRVQVFVPGTCF